MKVIKDGSIEVGEGSSSITNRHQWSILLQKMALTRGGKAKTVPPPQIFTTSTGIKVQKVIGGHVFQPAPLKVSCYLALDRSQAAISGQPNQKLYENVQKLIDKIIDQVEDHILGLTEQGIHTYQLIWL